MIHLIRAIYDPFVHNHTNSNDISLFFSFIGVAHKFPLMHKFIISFWNSTRLFSHAHFHNTRFLFQNFCYEHLALIEGTVSLSKYPLSPLTFLHLINLSLNLANQWKCPHLCRTLAEFSDSFKLNYYKGLREATEKLIVTMIILQSMSLEHHLR